MEIRIQAIKFTASEQLETYINKKLAKLIKNHEDIVSIDVYLKIVKPETALNKEVDIKIQSSLGEFFASKKTDTFEEGTDLTVDALEKQMAKSKEKMRSK